MPGGDGTGPIGMGPRAGRGAGFCGGAGAVRAGGRFRNRRGGAGGGNGRGGRGWRHMFHATGVPGWMRASGVGAGQPMEAPSREAEEQSLREEVEALQSQLDAVKKRLAESQASNAEE
jgi:hypothetical protein